MQIFGVSGSSINPIPKSPSVKVFSDPVSPYSTTSVNVELTNFIPTDEKNGVTYSCNSTAGNKSGTSSFKYSGLTPQIPYTFTVNAQSSVGTNYATVNYSPSTAPNTPDITSAYPISSTSAYVKFNNKNVLQNIIFDPTFRKPLDTSAEYWSGNYSTPDLSTEYSHSNNQSLKNYVFNNNNPDPETVFEWRRGYPIIDAKPDVTSGLTYYVTAWFYIPNGSPLNGSYIGFDDQKTNYYSSKPGFIEWTGNPSTQPVSINSTNATLIAGQWVQASSTFRAYEGKVFDRLRVFWLPSNSTSSLSYPFNNGNGYPIYMDDVSYGTFEAGGEAVTSFTATAIPGGASVTGTSSPLTITGLSSGTAYTIYVTAKNNNGASSPATASINMAAPTTPVIGTVTSVNEAEYSLTYTGGLSASSFSVTSTPSVPCRAVGATSPLRIIGAFSPNTSYTFSITATNSFGSSTASAASTAVVSGSNTYAASVIEPAAMDPNYQSDNATSVVKNPLNGVAVAGSYIGGYPDSTYTTYIALLSSSMKFIWAKHLTANAYSAYAASATDSSGNVYFAQQIIDPARPSLYAIHLVKFNYFGVLQWQRYVSDSQFNIGFYYLFRLTTDSAGNSYISGTLNSEARGFIIKYDTSGALQWQRIIYNTSPYTFGNVYGSTYDSSGNVYVLGQTLNASSGKSLTIFKYNSAGTFQWSKSYTGTGSAGNLYDYASTSRRCPISSDGTNIYFIGRMTNIGNILFKIEPTAGNITWQKSVDPNGEWDAAIYTDSSGNSYVHGNSGSTGFITKFNTSGSLLWNSEIVDEQEGYVDIYSATVDAQGRVVCAMDAININFSDNCVHVSIPSDGTKTDASRLIKPYPGVNQLFYRPYSLGTITVTNGTALSGTPTATQAASTFTSGTATEVLGDIIDTTPTNLKRADTYGVTYS